MSPLLFLKLFRKMNLRIKKLKAKVNPMLKNIVRANKAQSDIQKKYSLKSNPRLSSVCCPTVLFVGSIYVED